MTDDRIIKVDDVHKKYKVYYDKGSTLKERILFRNRNYYEDRWVLKGVSLDAKKGESIGVIGKNGAGKSTLLKLMAKIMYPDKGKIELVGRVSSLLELGAGFHPDMTGKENIYNNATIFGLSKEETDERLQSIIDFSELSDYLDNPVRTYSAGMYMRLAFAVAINVDADIMLTDEVLAVGDVAFVDKCLKKMHELTDAGMTIVIVGHNLGGIESFCDRTYWIKDGVVEMQGAPKEVHTEYLKYMDGKINPVVAV
jgi:ABC-2 type transport system ATP-binding protein